MVSRMQEGVLPIGSTCTDNDNGGSFALSGYLDDDASESKFGRGYHPDKDVLHT